MHHAVGVVSDFEGATLDQYDEILQLLGMSPRGRQSLAMKTDSGFRVTDVWESREAFEKFSQERVAPYADKVGLPNPPDVTFHEVHNYLREG